MSPVGFQAMGKKNEFIRIRADEALKEALARAASRDVRTEADEARYLLMKALGILAEEEHHPYETRAHPSHKKQGSGRS